MATIIKSLYDGSKNIVSVATTSSEVARALLALDKEANVTETNIAGIDDPQCVLNWVDITVRGDLTDKVVKLIISSLQDFKEAYTELKPKEAPKAKSTSVSKTSTESKSKTSTSKDSKPRSKRSYALKSSDDEGSSES